VSVGQCVGADPECGDLQTIEPCGYEAALVGRQFAHGVLDCYSLVRDFYARELGIQLSQYERGRLVGEGPGPLQPGPVGGGGLRGHARRAATRRHDPDADPLAGAEPCRRLGDGKMLHHMHGRLSETVVYGGMWAERTRYIVRHKEAGHD
jgi:hypothetical protein